MIPKSIPPTWFFQKIQSDLLHKYTWFGNDYHVLRDEDKFGNPYLVLLVNNIPIGATRRGGTDAITKELRKMLCEWMCRMCVFASKKRCAECKRWRILPQDKKWEYRPLTDYDVRSLDETCKLRVVDKETMRDYECETAIPSDE